MKDKRIAKKTLSLFILLIILCTVFPVQALAVDSKITVNESFSKGKGATDFSCYSIDDIEDDSRDLEIQYLLDKRANQLLSVLSSTDEGRKIDSSRRIELIDQELEELGVVILTSEQVASMLSKTSIDINSLEYGENSDENAGLRAVVPSSYVNTWMSYRSNYSYQGTTYEIQRLIAQPSSSASSLFDSATRVKACGYNWIAGVNNLLDCVAETALGPIPGASLVVSFVDAVQSTVSAINPYTEIHNPAITYIWSSVTTAVFAYVKVAVQSDDYQWLSLISTKAETEVLYAIPIFDYSNNGGDPISTPDIISDRRYIYATPNQYDSTSVAIAGYLSTNGFPFQRMVSDIQISGPESISVETIWPCYPNYPIHCE